MSIFISAIVVFVLSVLWSSWCNSKTFNQRTRMIDFLYTQEDWEELRDVFRAVSYYKHFWYLITFRNPAQLYPAVLQDALK